MAPDERDALRSLRYISLYTLLGLCAFYVAFMVYYRPRNPFSYPQVEARLLSTLYVAGAAVLVLSLPILLGLLPEAARVLVRIAAATGLKKHFDRLARTPQYRWAARKLRDFDAFLRPRFYPGKKYFFASVGLIAFVFLEIFVAFELAGFEQILALFFLAFIPFSYLTRMDDRAMIASGLLLLSSCPVFLLFNDQSRAEMSAIFAYYSLATGVILGTLEYFRQRRGNESFEAGE